MSNTFIEKGEKPFAEMIKEMDIDILLKGDQWEYVFCDKGQYTCHVGEGWIIRHEEMGDGPYTRVKELVVGGRESLIEKDTEQKSKRLLST